MRRPALSFILRPLLVCAMALALLGTVVARSQPTAHGAEEVKAAYLYKFVGFIEWPDSAFASAESPVVIGVAGTEAVYAELSRVLAGRTGHGRALVARRLVPGDPVDGVHVLFVGDAAIVRGPWMQRVRDRPLLIVTDTPQGLESGSALNFVLVDDRVRFEASSRAIERAGLKVSSRLLALAQRVVTSS